MSHKQVGRDRSGWSLMPDVLDEQPRPFDARIIARVTTQVLRKTVNDRWPSIARRIALGRQAPKAI